jgi:hypothetical protein
MFGRVGAALCAKICGAVMNCVCAFHVVVVYNIEYAVFLKKIRIDHYRREIK